jgi:predicted dehydrogenase
MRERLRAGVIGLGYGRAHVPGCQAAGVEVAAVCQRNRVQAELVARRYGVPKVFDRWEELVAQPEVNLVVVATPPYLHHPIALRALELGKHVLCEKPLAMNLREAREMAEAAAAAKRVAVTSFNWRFTPGMQALARLTEEGAPGRVFQVVATWLGSRFAAPDASHPWRLDRTLSGAGVLGDMGVHLIDLIRWRIGEFVRVCAQAATAYPEKATPQGTPADAEDYVSFLGELSTGAQAMIQASRAAHGYAFYHRLQLFGSGGALDYEIVGGRGRRWFRGELRQAMPRQPFQPVKLRGSLRKGLDPGDMSEVIGGATIRPLVKAMARAIRRGEPVSPSFADGVRAQAVLDAVVEAAASRAWVEVRG